MDPAGTIVMGIILLLVLAAIILPRFDKSETKAPD
jgi:hypothetical protein